MIKQKCHAISALAVLVLAATSLGSVAAELPPHGLAEHATVQGDWAGLPAQDEPRFGFSVAMDGGWLAVGAPDTIVDLDAPYGTARHGAVFLFHWEDGGWQYKERILQGYHGDSHCGYSVALDVPWLVLGCPGVGTVPENVNSGGAGFYMLDAQGTWNVKTTLTALNQGRCGTAVAVYGGGPSGNAIMVYGCPAEGPGLALLYGYDPLMDDVFGIQSLSPSDGASNDQFGASLSLHVDHNGPFGNQRLAVGAPTKSFSPSFWGGKVYVYDGTFLPWTVVDSMTHSNPSSYDSTVYGFDLAMLGDNLVIGSPGGGVTNPACATVPRCGLVERYQKTTSDWIYVGRALVSNSDNSQGTPSGPQVGMNFGFAVAFSTPGSIPPVVDAGDLVALGAPDTDDGNGDETGLVILRAAGNPGTRYGELRQRFGSLAAPFSHYGLSLDFGSEYRLAVGAPDHGSFITGRKGIVFLYGADRIFQDGFESVP